MSIALDGIEYVVNTPTENALDLLTYINNYCITHDIKNSKGTVVQFTTNMASPIWLVILGVGYLLNIYQKLVYTVGQNFSIASCSEQQLYNLMEIAGTQPLPATATLINIRVYADDKGDAYVPAGTSISLNDIIYNVLYDILAPVSSYGTGVLIAQTTGPLYVPAGIDKAFDQSVDNLKEIVRENSQPGNLAETVGEGRFRLQNITSNIAGYTGLTNKLRELPGVTSARAEFNTTITDIVVDGFTIPGRTCLLVIQGYSDLIAEIYWRYMIVPTTEGPVEQDYYLSSGQNIPVKWHTPASTGILLKLVITDQQGSLVYSASIIKEILQETNGRLAVGMNCTQAFICNQFEDEPSFTLVSAELSTDNGGTWQDYIEIGVLHVGVIDTENTVVVGV